MRGGSDSANDTITSAAVFISTSSRMTGLTGCSKEKWASGAPSLNRPETHCACRSSADRDHHARIDDDAPRYEQVAMLIDVREGSEHREGVVDRVWPQVVRLQSLDRCHRRHGYPSLYCQRKWSRSLSVETGIADRELGGVRRFPVGASDQPVGQVIKGGPQVVGELADEDRQLDRRVFLQRDPSRVATAFGIEVTVKAVRIALTVDVDFGLDACQQFLCPDDFGPDSFSWANHGRDSDHAATEHRPSVCCALRAVSSVGRFVAVPA